jgi:amino acid transporter
MSSSSTVTAETVGALKRNAVGVPGIVFFVVSAAAPLAAALGASPVAFASLGVGAPGAYIIAGLVLILFAVGYAAMSRFVTSTAGFAAYLESGFGRTAGFVGAALALLSYTCMLIALYGILGFFTSAIVADLTGLQLDWKVWSLIAWAGVAILGYMEINLSAKVLGVLMIGEVLILAIFDVGVLAQGGASGINFEAFQPSNVFSDGLGVALLFAASCFVGFEATAIYGEEAKDPRRTVPRATYAAVTLIAVFYAISTWAIGLAHGTEAVQTAAAEDPGNFVFAVNTQYVGHWATLLMNVLLVTSSFAVLVAFHNTLSRYNFALGRAGALPRSLGRSHPRWQSPHRASLAVTIVSIVILALFMLAGADPFAELYAWLIGVGTLGVLVMQAATSFAVLVFFLRRNRAELQLWSGVIAPVLGGIGLAGAAFLAVTNWDLMTGAKEGVPVLLPWLVVLAGATGVLWAIFSKVGSVAGARPGHQSAEHAASHVPEVRS